MTIERRISRFFGLRQTTHIEQIGHEEGIGIIGHNSKGDWQVKALKVVSPDQLRVTTYKRNPRASNLRQLFKPISSVLLDGDEINQADLHTDSDVYFMGRLVGVISWSWKP